MNNSLSETVSEDVKRAAMEYATLFAPKLGYDIRSWYWWRTYDAFIAGHLHSKRENETKPINETNL